MKKSRGSGLAGKTDGTGIGHRVPKQVFNRGGKRGGRKGRR